MGFHSESHFTPPIPQRDASTDILSQRGDDRLGAFNEYARASSRLGSFRNARKHEHTDEIREMSNMF